MLSVTFWGQDVTDLVVSVDVGELPLVAGNTHPLKLCAQVDELPPFFTLLVILFGIVGERVELLVRLCAQGRKLSTQAPNL